MRKTGKWASLLAGTAALLLVVSCSFSRPAEVSVSVKAMISAPKGLARMQRDLPAGIPRDTVTEESVNITPEDYKIALTYFSLIRDDDSEEVFLDTDADHAVVADFSDCEPGTAVSLFEGASIPSGTYVGYNMRFLYLEMKYVAAFHVPSVCTDHDDPYIDEATPTAKTFRQYFAAYGPFWKRDFVVEKPVSEDSEETHWYWLRREIDSSHADFFIDSTLNSHPAGETGPDNILDLFANDEFWGSQESLSDPDILITIQSGDTTGGLNAVMDTCELDADSELLLEIDITNCMNYKEYRPAAPPAGVTFTDGKMDIGPSYNNGGTSESYGDHGFHPFLPAFRLTKP